MKSLSSFRALRRTLCASASVLFTLHAVGDVTWNLVTDASTLAVDDIVIIAASGYDVALSTTQNNNNRGQATITKSGDTCTFGSDVQQFTLQAGTTSGSFAFYTGSGYIYAASSEKNYLRTETSQSANSSWAISIASGVATVIAQGANTRNKLQYNLSSKVFSCYASDSTTQKTICIYRKTGDDGDDPPPTPDAPTISVSPTSATVEENHAVTTTITTNNAVSVTATVNSNAVGSFSGNSWSWTPTAAGSYTVTFTATGASGTTPATATLAVTVTAAPSGPAVPTIAAANNLLSNGTGFTANWTAVSGVTGYQIQVATNALFDTVPNVILEEHFDTPAIPDGWSGSPTFYDNTSLCGQAPPSYKFDGNKNSSRTLATPSFTGGKSVSFYAKPNGTGHTSTIAVKETWPSGSGGTSETTYPAFTIDHAGTYSQTLSGSATKVSFIYTKVSDNVVFDDVLVTGTPINTVVNNPYSSASGASTSSLAITGLSPNTTYYVRVRSVSGTSHSDWSGYTTVTTEAGNTNYAPEITSFSPTSATVALGASQLFSLGYSDVNHNDTLTLAVTDNGTPLSSAPLAGVSGTTNYSYTATTPGTHTLLFTLSDQAGASTNASASVTVPVPVPTPSPINTATMLQDGTGFSVAWSAVPVATGYELQIGTSAMFEAYRECLLEEHFDALEDTVYPTDWTGSGTSDLDYNSGNYHGAALPAFKFTTAGQTLVSPTFSGGGSVSFYARPNTKPGSTFTVTEAKSSGAPETHSPITITDGGTYTQELSGNATQLTFTMTSREANVIFDDVAIYGPISDTLVQTTNVAASVTTVDLVNLDPNTTYYVRIRALYNGEASDWSAAVSATTPTGGANFPPELSVTPATASITGGASASFTVTYSDPNANDSLALAVSIDGTAATSLDIASGGTYTYTPATAGTHRLIFSVTDGLSTTYSTNDITVALAAPVMGAISNPTSNPYGFTANWTGVALNEGYEVEVATDPLFDAAPGAIVFSEDFTTLSDTAPPTAWTASADRELRYTSSNRCGELAPAFRFGTSGDTLESPTFPIGGTHLAFFAFSTKGSQTLYASGNTANGWETKTISIAEGRGNYETSFSSAVTGLRFEFTQETAGGYVGLDDIVVRTAKTVDSRVSRVRTAADATSNAFTGLAGAVSYYIRVRAVSDYAESDWSDTAEVPFLAAPENIQFHHGKYIEDGTSLSWNAAIGAASYNVKVLEANIVTNVPLVEEYFDLGKTEPEGWTFKNIDGTLGADYCKEPPSIKLSSAPTAEKPNDPKSSITTPTLEYPAKRVSFVASASGTTGGGTLTVFALTNSVWESVGTLSPGIKAKETFSFPLPVNTSKVKIEFTAKNSGTNFAVDDVIVWGTGPVWHDYANTYTNLTTTTLPLPGLRHDTPYIFTISSVNAFGEVAAEPFKVTSPPTNPGTIIRFF